MNTILPPLLQKNDKIAIISSARKINKSDLQIASQLFNSWGLEVVFGKTIDAEYNQFAGDDHLRAEDLQTMIEDKQIKAIFFAKGGYGSVRILDKINWKILQKNPKWLIGYSDVTAILIHTYYNIGIASVHGIMPINILNLDNSIAKSSLHDILFNGKNEIIVKSHPLNKLGTTKGELIGGNFSVIYSLLGSNSFLSTNNKILFIEDLDEYLYHIDRMMQALKRANKLKNLRALLVGQMTDMHDNNIPFGKTPYEIISEVANEYNFPVAFNLNIGHIGEDNHAFIHGLNTTIEITKDKVVIKQ